MFVCSTPFLRQLPSPPLFTAPPPVSNIIEAMDGSKMNCKRGILTGQRLVKTHIALNIHTVKNTSNRNMYNIQYRIDILSRPPTPRPQSFTCLLCSVSLFYPLSYPIVHIFFSSLVFISLAMNRPQAPKYIEKEPKK